MGAVLWTPGFLTSSCLCYTQNEAVLDRVASGLKLGPLGALANKGSCGLSIRYYDTAIAFFGAHFAADTHGTSCAAKRNSVCEPHLPYPM